MNKISVKYLKELNACEKGIAWFENSFRASEYTIEELLEIVKEKNIIPDYKCVSCIIRNCEFTQTQQMIDYYLLLNPDYKDVSWLISACEFAQTQEMIDYYLSLKPDYRDVRRIIEQCELAQTQQMIDYYISMNPDYTDVSRLIRNCEFAKNNEKLQKYLEKIIGENKMKNKMNISLIIILTFWILLVIILLIFSYNGIKLEKARDDNKKIAKEIIYYFNKYKISGPKERQFIRETIKSLYFDYDERRISDEKIKKFLYDIKIDNI